MEIKAFLSASIHPDSVDASGAIDRRLVGSVVFADEEKRLMLNRAVHMAVREDFAAWVAGFGGRCETVFVECAILCESGLDALVDDVWEVVAPDDVRVRRVCARNGLPEEQVLARMEAQSGEAAALANRPHETIPNDGLSPVLPVLEHLLAAERRI